MLRSTSPPIERKVLKSRSSTPPVHRKVFIDNNKSITTSHLSSDRDRLKHKQKERKVVKSNHGQTVQVTIGSSSRESFHRTKSGNSMASDRTLNRKSVKERLGIRGSMDEKPRYAESSKYQSKNQLKDWSSYEEDSDPRESDEKVNRDSREKHVKSKNYDRKVSHVDEAGFEPDYNESISSSDADSDVEMTDNESVGTDSDQSLSQTKHKSGKRKTKKESRSPVSDKKKKHKKKSKHKKTKHKKHKKEHKKEHKKHKKDKKKDKE